MTADPLGAEDLTAMSPWMANLPPESRDAVRRNVASAAHRRLTLPICRIIVVEHAIELHQPTCHMSRVFTPRAAPHPRGRLQVHGGEHEGGAGGRGCRSGIARRHEREERWQGKGRWRVNQLLLLLLLLPLKFCLLKERRN